MRLSVMSNVPASRPIHRTVEKALDRRTPMTEPSVFIVVFSFRLPGLLDTIVVKHKVPCARQENEDRGFSLPSLSCSAGCFASRVHTALAVPIFFPCSLRSSGSKCKAAESRQLLAAAFWKNDLA